MNTPTDFVEIYYKIGSELKKINVEKSLYVQNNRQFDYCILDIIDDEEEIDEYIELNEYLKEQKHNLILFNNLSYFMKILQSYKYDKDTIIQQFKLDLPRNEIWIDSNIVSDFELFQEKISQTEKINLKFNNNKKLQLNHLIMMICNQSTYAFPYYLMHKLYSSTQDSLAVTDLSENRFVKILNKSESISFQIGIDFGIKFINENKLINKIHIDLFIDTDIFKMNECQEFDFNNFIVKYGIIRWFIK